MMLPIRPFTPTARPAAIRGRRPLPTSSTCPTARKSRRPEYIGLVRAFEHALRLGSRQHLTVYSDSELMVKQMNGEYRVKNDDLRELYDQARKLQSRFESVRIRHVRRAQNKQADRLCNEALDGKRTSVVPSP